MKRAALHSLKQQVYALCSINSTKQLKKLLGKGYDFRRRATWLAIEAELQSGGDQLIANNKQENYQDWPVKKLRAFLTEKHGKIDRSLQKWHLVSLAEGDLSYL